MQSEAYKKVERDFSIKRQHAQSDAKRFKKNVYDDNPKLAEIEDKINPIEGKVNEINPLEMTPMEALNFLYELKKNIKEKQ